jgi:type III pantothenate kinase
MSVDLIADVGNGRTKLAIFQAGEALGLETVTNGDRDALRAACERLVKGWLPRRVGMAQVSPEPADVFRAWCREALDLEVRSLGEDLACPLELDVDEPEKVGADRMANAVWATRSHPSRSVVVIDLGTAITFDVVSARGAFVGGAIAAGARLQARGLHRHTALLPVVDLPSDPPLTLARKTREALAGGLFWGIVGTVDTICARIAVEIEEDPLVIATGGDAKAIAPHCPCVARVVPLLTLHGVLYALEAAEDADRE